LSARSRLQLWSICRPEASPGAWCIAQRPSSRSRHVEPVVYASLGIVGLVPCATGIRPSDILDMVCGKTALSRNTSQRRYSAQASRWDSGEIGKHKQLPRGTSCYSPRPSIPSSVIFPLIPSNTHLFVSKFSRLPKDHLYHHGRTESCPDHSWHRRSGCCHCPRASTRLSSSMFIPSTSATTIA